MTVELTKAIGKHRLLEVLLISGTDRRSKGLNKGLKWLEKCQRLKHVELNHLRVRDYDIKSIVKLKHLERLEIRGCQLSEKGLMMLGKLPKLRTLVVSEELLADPMIQRFKKAFPKIDLPKMIRIDFRDDHFRLRLNTPSADFIFMGIGTFMNYKETFYIPPPSGEMAQDTVPTSPYCHSRRIFLGDGGKAPVRHLPQMSDGTPWIMSNRISIYIKRDGNTIVVEDKEYDLHEPNRTLFVSYNRTGKLKDHSINTNLRFIPPKGASLGFESQEAFEASLILEKYKTRFCLVQEAKIKKKNDTLEKRKTDKHQIKYIHVATFNYKGNMAFNFSEIEKPRPGIRRFPLDIQPVRGLLTVVYEGMPPEDRGFLHAQGVLDSLPCGTEVYDVAVSGPFPLGPIKKALRSSQKLRIIHEYQQILQRTFWLIHRKSRHDDDSLGDSRPHVVALKSINDKLIIGHAASMGHLPQVEILHEGQTIRVLDAAPLGPSETLRKRGRIYSSIQRRLDEYLKTLKIDKKIKVAKRVPGKIIYERKLKSYEKKPLFYLNRDFEIVREE